MLAFGLLAIAGTTARAADQCVAFGGTIVGGECQISGPVLATGTFNLAILTNKPGDGGAAPDTGYGNRR
jgi:hypothetical protein